MLITENQNKKMWTKMLTEQFGVKDPYTLDWVSDYAQTHAIKEASVGLGGNMVATAAGPQIAGVGDGLTPGATIPAGGANGGPGVSPMYATPLNTIGMGNPSAPSQLPTGSMAAGDFYHQTPGSGDIPVSTLPMALNVALMTIGLELVPTIPTKGPWALLSYMDFPYAGGKLGRNNEIAGLDGRGEGRENKPLYFKVLPTGKVISILRKTGLFKENVKVTVTTSAGTVNGLFKSFGRMDGGLILEVIDSKATDGKTNISLKEVFAGDNKVIKVGDVDVATKVSDDDKTVYADEVEQTNVDFAQTLVDFVDGFANFATGKKEPMTRAQNETGTGNVIGLRLFSKWVQVGSYEVTATVTRQQLQDLPLYGVNAVSQVMEVCQNEITQSINARILERVFRLGVTNAVSLNNYQGVDLNLHMGTTDTTMAACDGIKEYKDIYDHDWKKDWGKVKNSEVNTSAENLSTRQRRIASRILAAANLIQVTNRRGPATWVVTNAQIAAALKDCSQYVVAPMTNTLSQPVTSNLYKAGTIAGLSVYVDPYMDWNDTRVCVGRKGSANEPGVIFMPYILADTVSLVSEGTMAPHMLVNSRYALVDNGWWPEKSYYTFIVDSPEFGII